MLITATKAQVGRVQNTAGTAMEPIIGCATRENRRSPQAWTEGTRPVGKG